MKKTIFLVVSILIVIGIIVGAIIFININKNNLKKEKENSNSKISVQNNEEVPNNDIIENANDESDYKNRKILVAFFSRAGENYSVGKVEVGNTELMAKNIAKITGGDLYKIEPIVDYPDGYEEAKEVAKVEQNQNSRPKIKKAIENFDEYDTIFIGYPIWYEDCPMIIYSFLESYDFSGKTVIPFNTHEGSENSGTYTKIKNELPNSVILDGLAIKGTEAREESSNTKIENWIQEILD